MAEIIPIRDVPGGLATPSEDNLLIIDDGIAMRRATAGDLMDSVGGTRFAPIGKGIPDGGTSGQVLARQPGGEADWQNAGTGDMAESVYDPNAIGADAFDRSNHTGEQPISATEGLTEALGGIGASLALKANQSDLGSAAGLNAPDSDDLSLDGDQLPLRKNVEANLTRKERKSFTAVAPLLADENLTYSPGLDRVSEGDLLRAGGFDYEVAADDASDHDLETAGGVKLYAAGQTVALAQLGAVNDGVSPCDDEFDKLLALSAATGREVAVHGRNYLLTREHSIPAGARLVAPYGPMLQGSGFVVTDNTIRSALLVGDTDISLDGVYIEMPVTFVAGITANAVLLNGASGARLNRITTRYGKMGIVVFDSDDAVLTECTTTASARYGFLHSGSRNVVYDGCRVIGTTDTTANDCFKICGKVTGFGTRSSYNVFVKNCHGQDAGAGQVIDIIMDDDSPNDLYNVFVDNLTGANCAHGFIEIKSADGLTTNWLHSVFVNGGSYKGGNGTDEDGIHIARRTENCYVRGVTVTDVRTGMACGNPGRRMVVEDLTVIRARQNGIECRWTGTMNKLIRPVVMDANYGQASSIYAGILLSNIGDIEVISPTVAVSEGSPSAFKHTYGIEFAGSNSRIVMSGVPSLIGHVTAPFSRSSGTIQWPMTINLGSFDLAASDAASAEIRASHEHAFQACAVSYTYQAASNVARTVTVTGRGASSRTVLAQASSDTAVIAQRDLHQLTTPIALTRSFPALQVTLSATTRPGSPTGRIIVELHGYTDAAVPN